MSVIPANDVTAEQQVAARISAGARRALAHERAGRFRLAWDEWETLRASGPGRSDWNAPLAASYLRYALGWTADGCEGSLQEAEEALLRGVSILTIDLDEGAEDVARLLMIARACEQRCILRAFGMNWTTGARDALEAGVAPDVTGEVRHVLAAGISAMAALDLVALAAPSLDTLSAELVQSCLRLATTLQAVGAEDEARAFEMRAETVLRGPVAAPTQPRLIAIEGGGETTPARRPDLRLVTSPTA